jgi:hypothetical protein
MNSADRSLLAATFVILGLAFFSVLTNVYPIVGFNTQSADEPIIPVWVSGDEEPTAEQSDDADTPTPTLLSSPTQSSPPEAAASAIDPSTSEVIEAALREPFVQEEPKKPDGAAKGDDLLGGAFSNPAGRFTDPVLPKVETPPLQNTINFSEEPALASTDQYPDVTGQPLPLQTPPPDSSVDTETFPQPSLDLPADMDTSWQLPPESSADTEAFPQP